MPLKRSSSTVTTSVPDCGRAYPIVKQIQEQLGPRLRFVFRNFPLAEIHPHAQHAAEAAEAAAAQGHFQEMHHALFEHQRALADPDLMRYAAEIGLDRRSFDRNSRIIARASGSRGLSKRRAERRRMGHRRSSSMDFVMMGRGISRR